MACMLCNRRIVITVQLCYRKKGQIMNGLQKWKRQSPLPTLFIPSTCRQRSVLAQCGQQLRRRPFGNKRILKKTFPKYQPHESRTLIYHTLMGPGILVQYIFTNLMNTRRWRIFMTNWHVLHWQTWGPTTKQTTQTA